MKTLKIYDDVHRAVKVEAAKSGRTTANAASELLRKAIEMVREGKIVLQETSPTAAP